MSPMFSAEALRAAWKLYIPGAGAGGRGGLGITGLWADRVWGVLGSCMVIGFRALGLIGFRVYRVHRVYIV